MRRRDKAWHGHLTIDTLLKVLHITLLHPWVAWIAVLSLRAQATPYTDTSFILATAYATLLTILAVLRAVSDRIAYGLPRDVDLGEEVVVVTGGASGLGLLIARIYGLRGVSVAVLDVKEVGEIEEGWEKGSGVEYYRCDIGNRREVEWVMGKISEDVRCIFFSFLFFLRGYGCHYFLRFFFFFFFDYIRANFDFSWARRRCWLIAPLLELTANRFYPYQQKPL